MKQKTIFLISQVLSFRFKKQPSKNVVDTTFKCQDHKCTFEQIATRDQIIIETSSDKIREEASKKSWNLEQLKRKSMQIESALHGVAEISGEAQLNKVG